ncbi:MAG: DNA methyltransferase, partial [Lachnospiraceae bacterium]
MYKSERERKKAAELFAEEWKERGKERGECQLFWIELLQNVYGVDEPKKFIKFEDAVKVDKRTKFIDARIPETHTLIEQKSRDIDMSKKRRQSNKKDMTPIEQARQYDNNLPYSQKSRYILTCNFMEFDIYDMEQPNKDPEIVLLKDLGEEFERLDFLVDCTSQKEKKQLEVSKKAADLVSELYDALLQQYKERESVQTQTSINMLCVRLVFCLYAEDAGIFPKKKQFREYLKSFRVENARIALKELFRVLDTKEEERDPYLNEALADFPYVNGRLFYDDGKMLIPNLNEKIISLLTDTEPLDFRWKDISPAVFGAAFESTLNPETRRKGGMHYTSIENIHKVIDPLFLDDLKEELDGILELKTAKVRIRRLEEFQDKLANLRFLDPACGSGNFLTETYICLRRLENEALKAMIASKKGHIEGQIIFGTGGIEPIKVQIHQFYGIEINDFAVAVAKTALWIAESQMMLETEDIVMQDLDFLPLKTYANIVEGNALRMDWNDVVPAGELNYIMGNPPFIGYSYQSANQKEDLKR